MYLWPLTFSQYYLQVFLSTIFRYFLVLSSCIFGHLPFLSTIFRYFSVSSSISQYYLQVFLSIFRYFSVLSSGISQYLQVFLSTVFRYFSVLSSGTYFLVLSSCIFGHLLFLSTIFRYLLLGAIFMYLWALTFPQYCLQVLTSWRCPCSLLLLLLSSAQFSYGLYRIFGLSRADLPLPSPLSAGFVSAGVSLDLRSVQQLQAQFVPGQGEGHRHPQAVEEDAQKGTAQWVVKQVVSVKRWGDKCDEMEGGGGGGG